VFQIDVALNELPATRSPVGNRDARPGRVLPLHEERRHVILTAAVRRSRRECNGANSQPPAGVECP
jgi:hypothetical protein